MNNKWIYLINHFQGLGTIKHLLIIIHVYPIRNRKNKSKKKKKNNTIIIIVTRITVISARSGIILIIINNNIYYFAHRSDTYFGAAGPYTTKRVTREKRNGRDDDDGVHGRDSRDSDVNNLYTRTPPWLVEHFIIITVMGNPIVGRTRRQDVWSIVFFFYTTLFHRYDPTRRIE